MSKYTKIKDLPSLNKQVEQHMALYKLSIPIKYGWGDNVKETAYVIVSAVGDTFDTGRAETYIFPADKTGKILDYGELTGSFRGAMDHEQALDGLVGN